MIRRRIREFIEQMLGCQIYRGWYPRGMNLKFDLSRIVNVNDPTIVDVGANRGQTSIALSNQFPHSTIYACEPVGSNFEALEGVTHQCQRIKPFKIAIGSESGNQRINLYEGTVNHSIKAHPNERPLAYETVTVLTLDAFCEQESIERIDFLKVDTEGFDLEVVRGASKLLAEGRICVVLAELGFSPANAKHVPFKEFDSFMQSQRMQLFGIYDQRREFDGTHRLRRADCLYVSEECERGHLDCSPDL